MKNIKHTLVSLSACLIVAAAMAGPAKDSPVFQMRLVAGDGSENLPSSRVEKMSLVTVDSATGQTNHHTLHVERAVLLDQHDLKNAHVLASTSTSQSEIEFELSKAGQKRFAEVTRQNIGKRLAIIIDGQVYSAPVIRSEINGKKGVISGNFTQQEARRLCDRINAAIKK